MSRFEILPTARRNLSLRSASLDAAGASNCALISEDASSAANRSNWRAFSRYSASFCIVHDLA